MENIDFLLKEYLDGLDRAVVAYSGGADSTVLLHVVSKLMPDRYEGVFVDSPLMSMRQREIALRNAYTLGLNVTVRRIGWRDMPDVLENDGRRCYHCKAAMFRTIATDDEKTICMDGENADDLSEDRPGRTAALEFGIRSPLAELGIGREEVIRTFSTLGLPAAIKDTCMATRIASGIPLTDALLRNVESYESMVRRIARVEQLRVRVYDGGVKVQTAPHEIPRLKEKWDAVRKEFLQKGLEATLDEDGYKG